MKKWKLFIVLFAQLVFVSQCGKKVSQHIQLHLPDNRHIRYTGRIDLSNPLRPRLSGAGSYFRVRFRGSQCDLTLENQDLYGNHNYMVIVIDDEYRGRMKVRRNKTRYTIATNLEDTHHTLLVCKATEAQVGYVDFLGISCGEILPIPDQRTRKIEFIGNSITCGYGLDTSDIPCDSAQWFDQHNAYLAFGPIVARALDADWLLSSVSGIGIIRNWNSPGPTMPDVYWNMYLNTDSTVAWDGQSFVPDLISICLGTNDFSDGDSTYERAVLDSTKFVKGYIRFIRDIRHRHPKSRICLLTSPMLLGDKVSRLGNYVRSVMQQVRLLDNDNHIHMFAFSTSYTNGCSYHPGKEDHRMMAEELLPFYKKVMSWESNSVTCDTGGFGESHELSEPKCMFNISMAMRAILSWRRFFHSARHSQSFTQRFIIRF
jgi:lysophospholipase L1-like esterase